MSIEPFSRLDNAPEVRKRLLPYCRLKTGDIWCDGVSGHKVGVLDVTKFDDVQKVFEEEKATLSFFD